jgi:hypothetical protein
MGRSTLRHFTCCRAICLFAGILISGALGCTSVKPPNFGTKDGATGGTGGSGDAGLDSDADGREANGDAGSFSDGKIATDGAKDGASFADGPSSGGGTTGSDGSVGGGGTSGFTGTGGTTGTGGITGTGGTAGSGGGPDAAPDVPAVPPDGSSFLAVGAPCSASSDCAAGNCVDGVCCAGACTGCNACKQTLTGKADGTCAPVASGQNPHNTCTDETATKPCGNDGTCDGAGACRKVSNSKICTQASCSGGSFTPAATCDGAGNCPAATPQDCGAFQCASTGCLKSCAAQTECDSGNYCNIAAGATSGTCAAKLPNGSVASQGLQCTSGIVADGVCCNQTCTSACSACTSTLNGQASTTTGQCLPVATGKAAPHSGCAASTSQPCGVDGTCDGSGNCHYPAVATSCAASTCSGSSLTTSTCSSAHTCVAATNPCPNSTVCANATSCGSTKIPGTTCTSGADCGSGYCVNNTCCTTSSCGTCQACNLNGLGTCSAKPANTADSACSGDCLTGTCSASATCNPKDAGTSCGASPSCSSKTKTVNQCNSSGVCSPSQTTCTYGCNTAGTDCASGVSQGGACSPTAPCLPGLSCTDGVCCTSASCGTCQACNLNGAGTCAPKPLNASDSACQASAANCQAAGCDGAGHCNAASVGTSCGSDVCMNGPEDSLTPGQYSSPSFQRRLCDGSVGSSHCVLGSNQGCTNNLTCASATACRTVCARDADCVASYVGGTYYCAGVTCLLRNSNGVACTNHNQCLSRVCQGTCVQCASDDDCPVINPSCCSGTCSPAGQCDDNYSNADGSLNCHLQGLCGSRHSVCTGVACGCGSVLDCPNGSICEPGSPAKCLVNGGQPCVQNSDCLSGTCTTGGLCATSLAGAICDNSGGTTRPTGCSTSNCDDQGETKPTSICY